MSKIKKISAAVADRGYDCDCDDNNVLVQQKLGWYSIIPARNEQVPIWKTFRGYRKKMKYGCNKLLYHQSNKDETIISVIKRLFGEHIISWLIRMQDGDGFSDAWCIT
ncbi:MAG: hypothetical protein DA328_07505 [Nitrososphaeraceae archaeon]|nr:hypothetical protein [Nitrososphaeraceae archaeon]